MLVFVDETGADKRNTCRNYSYSLRGKTPKSHEILVRGERVSAIACMSCADLLDIKIIKGTANGDTFYSFVQTHLLPHLLPFNGTNSHSVVVLDNCSIHHIEESVKSIQDVGSLVQFLPHYYRIIIPSKNCFLKLNTSFDQWNLKCNTWTYNYRYWLVLLQ